ncbi:MAG: hypothetical protein RLZZ505_47 [Verrucomicrobiota bacterium]|jgi:hypothetical protein
MKKLTYLLLILSSVHCRGEATEHQLFWSAGFNSSFSFSSIHQSESTTFISGFKNPIDATSDGQKVYFTNGASLYSLDFGATVAIELLSFFDHGISPNSIAIHDGTLFVADSTKIYRSSLSNIVFQTILENPDGYISDMVTDGVDIFWADEENGIYRVPVLGGNPVVVASSLGSPMSLTFFQEAIFWTEDGTKQLRKVNKDGTGDTLILDLDSEFGSANYLPQSISLAANRIWWSDVSLDAIYSCRIDGTDVEEVSVQPDALAWVFPNTETGEVGIGPLKVEKATTEEGGFSISWNARTGQTYSIFTSENLAFNDPTFTSIADYKFFHSGILQSANRQFYVIAEE